MPIRGDHRQAFNLSLRDEQAVEGIAMMERQVFKSRRVLFVYAQDWYPVRPQDVHDVGCERDFAE